MSGLGPVPFDPSKVVLGEGQEFTDLRGTRLAGTVYLNTTGRAKEVVIGYQNSSVVQFPRMSPDGTNWVRLGHSNSNPVGMSAIWPKGWFFELPQTGGTTDVLAWAELE